MNEIVKINIANRLKKCELPITLHLGLKMITKTPVIDMLPLPANSNAPKQWRTCVSRSLEAGHKVKTVCDKCTHPVCWKHVVPISEEFKEKYCNKFCFIKQILKVWDIWNSKISRYGIVLVHFFCFF